ncbi:Bsp6I family type II restriction endonuclease [Tissierella carlieri]|uniref:Bsp6I family type II restriction endonuclease n=1 Tax=Tissierella carlieri TaxID=689904 RepID=A0ABT1S6Z0_9FIRM|nr:Bsp6I family type II restriction endonuclease [Tissierella carlieri]MCQ4922234.1 Bsp6I family type II restriction endonuclease [Tissierella carlieri]
MRIETKVLNLPEGDFFASVSIFDHEDAKALFTIYDSWRLLCRLLNELNARSVNLPEGLSETAFCIAKNVWRCTSNIAGANSSYDCYDPNASRGNNRIQIKACSVLPDLTSFGPNSEWDRIYFVDFYRNGEWDGTFDIYEVETEDINNFPVNASQTLLDQKLQGRRPRFSIYKGLIQEGRYISKETFKITPEGILEV